MSNKSVGYAMLLLIVGNLIAVFSDALIKTLDDGVAVFQFVFFRQLTAVIILLPFCAKNALPSFTQGLKWHALRAHIWLFGAVFMVFAINSMPLATANAIFYAAPLIMLPLAFVFFREKLTKKSVMTGVVGFIGVLVVIRPTHIDWAAISALVVALTLAGNNLLIRKLPTNQTVAQTLLLTNAVGMPASLGLALWEGETWNWTPLLTAAGSSFFILIYAATCVVAYRSVESNKIASAEYSGLLGAVLVGILWFGEIPEVEMLIGSALIILPLLLLAKVERKQKKACANAEQSTIDTPLESEFSLSTER
ncbi:membrane protein [Photobacterium swingsii]|uniref:EamA/RhaT family transporter n=1 Tax=Photobacterium swingsii TaxID=680026 RepID=A0A0J8V648_9GAMM|nr:DMT family transporter [Photobacterium swingsii]KMV28923.1 membrane protein [Photobacterium swingsii]PSW24627.1 EamA/RhaT family transporter [Photobacterium swingsii]